MNYSRLPSYTTKRGEYTRIIFPLLILTFFFSISAEAGTPWELFAETEGIRFYVDKESISHPSKNLVKGWVKAVPNTFFKIGAKYMIYQLEYEEHDCKENKFLFLHVTSYYSDGTSEDVFSKPSAWIDVAVLSTIFKEKHKYLCKDRELPSDQNSLQDQIPAEGIFERQWLRDMLAMLNLPLRIPI